LAASLRDPVAWASAALALALSVFSGLGLSTRNVELNLGPGDGAFVQGFEANSDVEDKVGWHWTTYDASIELPFSTVGTDLDVELVFARVFGEEAVVEVAVSGIRTETFRARGGEVRQVRLRAPGASGPLTVQIRTDSHEKRNMGLRLDRLSVTASQGEPFRLYGMAALRPLITAALLLGGLLLLGAAPRVASCVALFFAVAYAVSAAAHLFTTWRQLDLAPPMLIVSTVFLAAGKHLIARTGLMKTPVAAALAAAALVTMLFRLILISHPDFYYPDLLTHTRVVETIRAQGLSFFLDPATALGSQGAWTKPVLGGVSSLPYAVMFHAPFAILAAIADLSLDEIELSLKALGALLSVCPVLIAGTIAARLSLPPLAALLLCVIPAYTSRLSFALMPSLLGHAFDLLAMLAVLCLVQDLGKSARSVAIAFVALLGGHLSYTSSVVNEGLFMLTLLILSCASAGHRWWLPLRLLMIEAAAALLAFALYYRHFVGDVFGLVSRLVTSRAMTVSGGGGATSSVYPIESFWAILFERTGSFFGWSWIALFAGGLLVSGRSPMTSLVVPAWGMTYLALILLRAKIPDVFRYGHETLFVAPLICIFAGAAFIAGLRKGGMLRLLSVLGLAALVAVSAGEQWRAVAAQLANAR
jgi:hypothetical protein